jgi:hypothetical protein
LLQNSKIKAVFVDFYKKVDKAIMDQTGSKSAHASSNAGKSLSMIRPKSIVKQDACCDVKLSMVADNIWKLHQDSKEKQTDEKCYKHLIKFYYNRHPK